MGFNLNSVYRMFYLVPQQVGSYSYYARQLIRFVVRLLEAINRVGI